MELWELEGLIVSLFESIPLDELPDEFRVLQNPKAVNVVNIVIQYYAATDFRGDGLTYADLLKHPNAQPQLDNNYAIRYAACNGIVKNVEALLQDSRVDPSDEDCRCIKRATDNEHLEIVKLLYTDRRVQKKIDVFEIIQVLSLTQEINEVEAIFDVVEFKIR